MSDDWCEYDMRMAEIYAGEFAEGLERIAEIMIEHELTLNVDGGGEINIENDMGAYHNLGEKIDGARLKEIAEKVRW